MPSPLFTYLKTASIHVSYVELFLALSASHQNNYVYFLRKCRKEVKLCNITRALVLLLNMCFQLIEEYY